MEGLICKRFAPKASSAEHRPPLYKNSRLSITKEVSTLFAISPMPEMSADHSAIKEVRTRSNTVGIVLCVACIFFGACAENAMSNWISSFMENSLKKLNYPA